MDEDQQTQIVAELSDAAFEVTAGTVRGICLMLEHYDGSVVLYYRAPTGSRLEDLTAFGDAADADAGTGQTCH